MARRILIGLVLAAALNGAAGIAGPVRAAEPPVSTIAVNAGDEQLRFVPLGIGKSVIIDLPRDAKDVLVANPQIANAVVRTARRAYLIGVNVGQTNVFFFDAQGQQIAGFDIAVTRDLNGVRAAIKRALPNFDVRIDGVGDGVVLSGTVTNATDAQQAYDLAARLVGDGAKVVNSLTVRGRDQIMLKVTVAEIQRDVVKQLGINLNASIGYGTSVLNLNTDNPFTLNPAGPLSSTAVSPGWSSGTNINPNGLTATNTVGATLRAMERAGVIRTLAEPNITAISGETADFLAGGEFPVITTITCQPGTSICTPQVEFKKFGVALSFTPVVLTEGRISLKVKTEVSELSAEGAVNFGAFNIPSLRVRRADSTLEIPSGGTLALAGMIQEQTKQQINGFPGLQQVPILGTLFRSREYINRQSELVVFVTPYVVRAVAQKELSRPDDGFVDASDPAGVLLGRLNRIYGVAGRPGPSKGYHGSYGFILD